VATGARIVHIIRQWRSIMARNQEAQRSQTTDRQPSEETHDDRATGRSSSEAVAGRSATSATSQGAGQRGDQEQHRDVSREGGAIGSQVSGTGMQTSSSRQGGRGGMTAGRGQMQSSILPALMANPALMTRAFMSNPFAFADAINQEMDRLFSTAGGDLASSARQSGSGTRGRAATQWIPAMEVRQRDDGIVIHADLPGLTPDDVNVELEDGVLTISGERRDTSEDRQEGRYHSERSYGAFSRSIALPDGVNEDQVNARFEHGVLQVTVPIQQQQLSRGRRVPIQSGASQGSSQRGAGRQQGGQQQNAQQQNAQQQNAQQQNAQGGQQSDQQHGDQPRGQQQKAQQQGGQPQRGST
jgi:HSP20 family protein